MGPFTIEIQAGEIVPLFCSSCREPYQPSEPDLSNSFCPYCRAYNDHEAHPPFRILEEDERP